jgi:hypothetical protein
MNGQWFGPYSGTNQGLLVVDLDDVGEHYDGSASALDNNAQLPPIYADFTRAPIPKEKTEFDLTVPLMPIDRVSGNVTTWNEVAKIYPPDVVVPNAAETHWKVAGDKIELSWRTDGTHGIGIVKKSKGYLDSTLEPLAEIKTWEDFRRFTRELEPYRYIFRGQTSNKWRLRTSFHRTGRASLMKFMVRDIPILHRHLSGMMAHHVDLRDPLQNAAFYNLVQHHGYPTPLLDWTYSPFIAAYFAYKGAPRSSVKPADRVRLFVFDKLRWCQEFEMIGLVMPPKLHFTVLEPLALNNPRVVPQQSVSSVTNIEDIEAYLTDREKRAGRKYLRVIDLPASERNAVMQELSLMGITAGSLFPGVDGACEQVRERFFSAL